MNKPVDAHYSKENWYGKVVCVHCGARITNRGLPKVRHLLTAKCKKAQGKTGSVAETL